MTDNENLSGDRHDELNIISIVELLWRYRLLLGGITLLAIVLALWLAYTTPFAYRAEVVVTPVTQNDNGGAGALAGGFGGLASLAGIRLPGGSASEEAQAMLRSRHLAERFIATNKLTSRILGNSPRQSLWLAVDRFKQTVLTVRIDKESGTTLVSVRWGDPKEAADWANGYVALVNEIMRNRAIEESSRNIKFLNEQISKTPVVEIQRVMYSLIENETKNNMLASTRPQYAFTVIDPAVAPEDRIWPRRSIIAITGAAIGGILGCLLALAHDLWRRNWKKKKP